jgi:hypothetical protein
LADERNFLLGYGERLTERVPPPGRDLKKSEPYSVEEARERLSPQLAAAAAEIEHLPELACPANQAVAVLTMHPQFIAKSYYPEQLLEQAQLRPVGSRPTRVRPEKWTRKGKEPETSLSTDLFVAGPRDSLLRWADHLRSNEALEKGENQIARIESIRVPASDERLRNVPSGSDQLLEVVLHASNDRAAGYIVAGFERYLRSIGMSADLERRLYAGGLCFVPVRAGDGTLAELGRFSFLRIARPMPSLRVMTPIERVNTSLTFPTILPADGPIDPDLRVAVFDGGVDASSPLQPWVSPIEAAGVGPPENKYLTHGHAVTSAILFGPLFDGVPVARPYAFVDHYRVLDTESENEPMELYDVLHRIQDVLETHEYQFVSFSIGPSLPIEDDDVHPWTAVLDEHLSPGHALAALAVGNNGREDRASGNARVQVPSDCVNAIAVGAADSSKSTWKRASYSALGPGRSPGFVKPDVLSFGGSAHEPFYVVAPTSPDSAAGAEGTSFSTPSAMRLALGVRAHFGSRISPLALKALLIHCAEDPPTIDRAECGWGRIPDTIDNLVVCADDSTRVIYQGELTAASYVRAQLPFPAGQLAGKVEITATFCFASETDPQDPGNYTRSGLEVRFRPRADIFSSEQSVLPKSKSFFSVSEWASEEELRRDAQMWETTLHQRKTMLGSSLLRPVLDFHYNARSGGHANVGAPRLKYALVVTVRCPSMPNLYDQVRRAFATQLEPLQPVIEIPITI